MSGLISNVLVHVVGSTLLREPVIEPVIEPSMDPMLAYVVRQKAAQLASHLLAVGCASDHVHAAFRLRSAEPVGRAIGQLKGRSSPFINHTAKTAPTLRWQPGYWGESISPGALHDVLSSISDQRRHHAGATGAPRERWELAALARGVQTASRPLEHQARRRK